jgi:hypothetical protein
MKINIKKFQDFRLSSNQLSAIKRGSGCGCHQAVPYDCEYLGGHQPGTGAFYNCMVEGYQGCCSVDTTCHCSPQE